MRSKCQANALITIKQKVRLGGVDFADYLVRFGSFMVATVAALLVGKAVLVANALPFLRRYDAGPQPANRDAHTR